MNYLFIDTAEGTRTLLKLGAEERYFYDENMARSEIGRASCRERVFILV